jgi:hypothetical protein
MPTTRGHAVRAEGKSGKEEGGPMTETKCLKRTNQHSGDSSNSEVQVVKKLKIGADIKNGKDQHDNKPDKENSAPKTKSVLTTKTRYVGVKELTKHKDQGTFVAVHHPDNKHRPSADFSARLQQELPLEIQQSLDLDDLTDLIWRHDKSSNYARLWGHVENNSSWLPALEIPGEEEYIFFQPCPKSFLRTLVGS